MRKILAGTLLVLIALASVAVADVQYPMRSWVEPGGDAVIDTVCSHGSWRDTVYFATETAPAGTMHVSVAYDWASYWVISCPPDDNDAGVYVWWLPIWNSVEAGSMLVRQNTSWTSYIPVKGWYLRAANATADSCVRYQLRFEGKPTQ